MNVAVRRGGAGNTQTVLVCVLKSERDLRLLLRERWYRIPAAFLPRRKFTHLAFYQPAVFGKRGKCIAYSARVVRKRMYRRVGLLPNEPKHPRAEDMYLKIEVDSIRHLPKPVRNIVPRRVSFGFTTLRALQSARDILELYGVPKTEQILSARLARSGIQAVAEHTVSARGRRCRIDLALWCARGALAIECDNVRAHASKIQREKDAWKDRFLSRLGWTVLRFAERDIVERADWCVVQVQKAIRSFGGMLAT